MHERLVLKGVVDRLVSVVFRGLRLARAFIREAVRPLEPAIGFVVDSARPRRLLVAENLLLRQQLLVLSRQLERPKLTTVDRAVLVGASALTQPCNGARLSA